MTRFVVFVCFSYFVSTPCLAANTFKAFDELLLRAYLEPARDSNVLPVLDKVEMAKFVINLTVPPDHILDLSMDSANVLWLEMVLCMHWNSSALMWNPQDFNNVTYSAFYSQLIWTPFLVVHEKVISQLTYLSYWKTRMAPVTVKFNGYTEYCPQVHVPFVCSVEESYDAFPTEEILCNSIIRGLSPLALNLYVENRTNIRHDFNKSFSGSGFELQFLTTEQGKNSAILRVGIRRDSSQWLSLVTIPVFLVSLLSLLSLWLPNQTPTRSLTFCFAFVTVLLLQIQLYSAHLTHCSKPPMVLALLQQLVVGQLVIAILLVLEIAIGTSPRSQQLYNQLEWVYRHSIVHKYVEWARVQFFGWAFETFEDEVDLKESEESHEDEDFNSQTNLISVCRTPVRLLISAVIMFHTCRFGLTFL